MLTEHDIMEYIVFGYFALGFLYGMVVLKYLEWCWRRK